MDHTEKYLQAKWVTENPNGYDERDIMDAKRYCNAYLDGYNQALRIHDVVGRSEQLANFCKKISKQEDCPAEFQEIVNKEFWNLIG